MKLKIRWVLLAALAAAAVVVAGCGGGEDDGGGAAPTDAAEIAPETKGVPDALADNRAQANQILDEGTLDAKLAELRGHPIVVNQWASWCEPCRAEFPHFQETAETHAKDIAFLGIDMQDDRDAAEDFLAELPVPFPSIFDPTAEQISSLGGGFVSPTTVFIDARGEIVNVFQGSYATREQLEADIDRYLLGPEA